MCFFSPPKLHRRMRAGCRYSSLSSFCLFPSDRHRVRVNFFSLRQPPSRLAKWLSSPLESSLDLLASFPSPLVFFWFIPLFCLAFTRHRTVFLFCETRRVRVPSKFPPPQNSLMLERQTSVPGQLTVMEFATFEQMFQAFVRLFCHPRRPGSYPVSFPISLV